MLADGAEAFMNTEAPAELGNKHHPGYQDLRK
jgi:hypothetical protein